MQQLARESTLSFYFYPTHTYIACPHLGHYLCHGTCCLSPPCAFSTHSWTRGQVEPLVRRCYNYAQLRQSPAESLYKCQRVCEWEQIQIGRQRRRQREGDTVSLHCARLIIKMSPVTLFALLYISQRGLEGKTTTTSCIGEPAAAAAAAA